MAPTEALLSDIAGGINRMDVRQSIITPTVAKLFRPDDVPRFEKLIVGGKPLTPDVVETWGRRCRILNVYGPTETSMGAFPKLPSRKVDRKALRKLAVELDPSYLSGCSLGGPRDGSGSHVVVATETPAERALESMWADVFSLPAEQIGPQANYLALGGDSISAITLASFSREAGYALSVPNILKMPKLKDMAATMKAVSKGAAAAKSAVVFEVPDNVKAPARAAGLGWGDGVEYGKCREARVPSRHHPQHGFP